MKETFIEVNFHSKSLNQIAVCNDIIDQYQAQGFRLTLRQLYYQLVSRNLLSNTERDYKNLGKLVSQGRLAGEIDWEAIEDRLRSPQKTAEWKSPADILDAAISGYALPRWDSQQNYVELWCEKDALAGVLAPLTNLYHITLMVNRGYSSQSAMKESAERLASAYYDGKDVTLFYIGDLDPSGEDMVRDVEDRLNLLTKNLIEFKVIKLAITPEQVAQFNPPPNPAKMSDSRAAKFVALHGDSSYEADALPPDALATTVREAVGLEIDWDAWDEVLAAEERDKRLLQQAKDEVMRQREEETNRRRQEEEEDPEEQA